VTGIVEANDKLVIGLYPLLGIQGQWCSVVRSAELKLAIIGVSDGEEVSAPVWWKRSIVWLIRERAITQVMAL